MKVFLIILGVLIVLFLAFQLVLMNGRNNIESYPYKVIKEYDSFEIRSYEASLFTSVKLPMKSYDKAASKGFSILASYIFGGNDKEEKIAMTSPVSISLEDSMTVMFMVPKKYNQASLPKPNQSQIEFRTEPKKKVAAITFGGWANDRRIEDYKDELVAALKANGIDHTGRFYFLGYNPPYEVFNRRNEIIVELPSENQ